MTLHYYDRAGNPTSVDDWFKSGDNRVALDEDVAGYLVSTVHLGIDHQYGDGPPLIFETMVFGKSEAATELLDPDGEMWRYSTEAQAVDGHKAVVAWLLHEGPKP